ncbi:MAG: GAF domain-containing protein, partial [Chloroflexi bacterium]|nr:GAF domain-containing protein [Chloroflexota bacterium]
MQSSSSVPRIQTQGLLIGLTLITLIVSGVLLIAYAYTALEWYNQPFIGFLTLRNLEITGNGTLIGDDWGMVESELLAGDRLDRFEGVELGTLAVGERIPKLNELLSERSVGERITISFLRDDSVSVEKPVGAHCADVPDAPGLRRCGMYTRLNQMPLGDLMGYFGLGWLSGVGLWLVAAGVFWRQWDSPNIRYITMVAALLSVFLAGRFDTVTTYRFTWAWLAFTCLGAGLAIVLALEFPYRFAFAQQMPVWFWSPVIVALALGGASIALFRSGDSNLNQAAYVLALGTMIAGNLILLGTMGWRRSRSASPIARNQSTMIVIGQTPMLIPLVLWFGVALFGDQPNSAIIVLAQVLPILFPLAALYAALQFRLVDTDRVITQTTLYGAMLALMTLSYWLIVAAIAVIVGRNTRDTALSPLLIFTAIFVVAITFNPLRALLQRAIDAVYFRARRQYQTYLEKFSRDVTQAVSLADVTRLIQNTLDKTLSPTHMILFVRDIVIYEYRPQPDPTTGQLITDVTFVSESGLVRYLRERASVLDLLEGRPLPLDVISDRARVALLGAPIIVGLRGQKVLNGFLAVGPRKNGVPYVHEDIRFIESLSDQIALAVERAQAVDDLERRVRVQDVLSQVSRALNFAIDFDTLLELVYAQTLRVIDAPCFYIALRDLNTDELYYVFYNQGEDRLQEKEGQRWRMGRDLISEIARSRQTLRTDDYVRESLLRDPHTPPENPNLRAWMGVPLLADTGEGVLGVIVASTTQPGAIYTDDQQDLFWDIANLAASAIDKLQLFDKTQLRARQLAAINEISNQLASEMGNVDRLLNLITENAVTILNSEAGSLLLIDEESGDLEFRVVIGGAGQDLIGKRLPAGTGLAGATIQRGTPIIVNDPNRDTRWYGDIRSTSEQQVTTSGGDNGRDVVVGTRESAPEGGFRSGAILSVPLMVGGRATGVIQILNKRDASVFVPEDADLLQTFAGQAAIAIENARLFDMTDQQLAARVQELDTMQRIDQELNRTLDLLKVVDITMEWAASKCGASAGAMFIRARESNELFLVHSRGYPPQAPFAPGSDAMLVGDRGVVGRVIRTGQPSLITDVQMDPDYYETYPGCVAQLTVPLFSANRVIGVIILESDIEGELDLLDLDFMSRLAEHASPAIVNS